MTMIRSIRYDILYDSIRIRYNTKWYDTIQYIIQYDTIRYDMIGCVNRTPSDAYIIYSHCEHNRRKFKSASKKTQVMEKRLSEAARKQNNANQLPAEQWLGIFGLSTVLLQPWANRTRSMLDNWCLTVWDVLFWNSAAICPSKLKSYWVLCFLFFHLGAMIRAAWQIFWRLVLFS